MTILTISASLREGSRSRILAVAAHTAVADSTAEALWLDLRETPLPFCDAGAAYGHAGAVAAKQLIARADGFIIATPIYNYAVNAALKNLLELTGDGWEGKVAGFLCAAGGASSYMAVMSFANSLMLDFRTLIVPRFVYATGADFGGAGIANPEVEKRAIALAREVVRISGAVKVSSAQAGPLA